MVLLDASFALTQSFRKGAVYKLREDGTQGFRIYKDERGEPNGYGSMEKLVLRKATPEEIKEYESIKVGDYVVYQGSGSGRTTLDNTYKIAKVDDNGAIHLTWYHGKFETRHYGSTLEKMNEENYFRKATREEIDQANAAYKAFHEVCVEGYNATVETIKDSKVIAFGCNKFTLAQLEAYYYFLVVGSGRTMFVGKTLITTELLSRLINLIK